MYYTRVRTSYSWWGIGNDVTSFENMPQIKQISRDEEGYYTAEGYFENDYKDEYLGEGESLGAWDKSPRRYIGKLKMERIHRKYA